MKRYGPVAAWVPTRSRRRRAAAMAGVALALGVGALGGACGVPIDQEPRAITPATRPLETSPTTTGSPSAPDVDVYFLDDDRLVARRFPADSLDAALGLTLASPEGDTAKTRIPPGTALLEVVVTDGTASIDLSDPILDIGGEPQKQAFAQLAFTAFAYPGVDRVTFQVTGVAIEVPTDQGAQAEVTAEDYDPPLRPA